MAGNKTSMNISLRLMAGQFTKGLKNIRRQIDTFGRYIRSAFALGSVTAFGRSVVKVGADFGIHMQMQNALFKFWNEEHPRRTTFHEKFFFFEFFVHSRMIAREF